MTLDELIKQQLSLGKKLGDIKVANEPLIDGYFIPYYKCNQRAWHGLSSFDSSFYFKEYESGWHLYSEPKVKKKFWQWSVKNHSGAWFRHDLYLDELGCNTTGAKHLSSWERLEKRKVEDSLLEIEVDSE